MQIDKSALERIQESVRTLFVRSAASQPTELEARYAAFDPDDELTRQTFMDTLRYFRTMSPDGAMTESTTVDVTVTLSPSSSPSSSSYRLTFPSHDAFEDWIASRRARRDTGGSEEEEEKDGDGVGDGICGIHGVELVRLTRVGEPVDLREYNLRVKLKEEDPRVEEPVKQLVTKALLSPDAEKSMRRKHRFSVPSTKDADFRYDFTSVSGYKVNDITAAGGGIGSGLQHQQQRIAAKETFEIELEYVGEQAADASDTNLRRQLTIRLLKASNILLKVIENTDHLLTKTEKQSVIDEYARLVGSRRAIGPKPVTLTRQNLAPPGLFPGVVSVIGGGYTLTEKADGERRLLFVSEDGKAYLVSDRLGVTFTGLMLRNSMGTRTLLDGEFLPALSADPPLRPLPRPPLFMCFDAFFVGGADVRGLPLWAPDRLGMASDTDRKQPQASSGGANKSRDRKTGKTGTGTGHADRLGACERIIVHEGFVPEGSSSSNSFECRVKTFYPVDSFRDLARHASTIFKRRDAGLFPYDIDGLIFTPADLPMGASRDPDTGALIPASPSGTGGWSDALKWKPPSMNTIDFLVRFHGQDMVVEEDTGGVGGMTASAASVTTASATTASATVRRVVDLYVGTSEEPAQPVDPLDFLNGGWMQRHAHPHAHPHRSGSGSKDRQNHQQQHYRAVLFQPPGESRTVSQAHLPLDGSGRIMIDGDEMRDGSIVEFAYEMTESDTGRERPPPLAWTPLRIRHDKTARLHQTKSLAGTLNDARKTAYQVWEAVWEPVTERMLTGEDEHALTATVADQAAKPSTLYYNTQRHQQKRTESASYAMNAFHNAWIKWRTLLEPFSGGVVSLFDLGTGQGGDVRKWFDMKGLRRVLGIDLVEESLVRAGSGAYERLGQQMQAQLRGGNMRRDLPMVVFLPMDASKPMHGASGPADALSTSNERFARLANIVWGQEPAENVSEPELRSLHGMARMPFDLATAQFAVHYFFSDMGTLRTFASNVADALKPGGFFVGSCLDGRKVDAKLKGLRVGDHVRGVGKGGNRRFSPHGSQGPRGSQGPQGDEDRLMWHITKLYDGSLVPSHFPFSSGVSRTGGGGGANREKKKKNREEGEDDQHQRQRRQYEDRTGKRIRVYMETIGQALDEYLVDFELFEKVMDEVGLEPISKDVSERMGFPSVDDMVAGGGTFEDAYADMVEKAALGKAAGENDKGVSAALSMSDVHKEYSFMNRWFVFRKRA